MSESVYKNITKNGPSDLNVVLWLFLFFPVGLYKVWKHQKFTKKTRWVVTGVFGVLFLYSYNQSVGNYDKFKARSQRTVASDLAMTKKNYQIGKLSQEIQERVQNGKNPLDYAVTVSHVQFNGHDLLACNVNNGKANCGVYEVIEKDGIFTAYWVNGKAKSKLGTVLGRTPSSIDPSAAYKAVTK